MDTGTIFSAAIVKVDSTLGIVFGWACLCKRGDDDEYDLQKDHIPESTMLEAAVDFAMNSRVHKVMHSKTDPPDGDGVIFQFPLTADVAKAFGIQTKTTGWMIGVKPSPATLAKFIDGTYTGFSIGGTASYQIEDAS